MNRIRVFAFTAALVLIAPTVMPLASSPVCAATERVVSGELVIVDAAHNRFRIVGHAGTFTAPAGTSLSDLDGKPVQVELAGGRVTEIRPAPVHIEPVVHAQESIQGMLAVIDPMARTFTIAGDNRVYVAPPEVNLQQYAGRMVQLRLGETGQVVALSPASGPVAGDVPMASPRSCMYGGATLSSGSTICRDGTSLRCNDGAWMNTGTACQ